MFGKCNNFSMAIKKKFDKQKKELAIYFLVWYS